MSKQTCPQCGTDLRKEVAQQRTVTFPCSNCGVQLQIADWYMMLTAYGSIAIPPIIFWALGLSWQRFIIAELLVGYPFFLIVVNYLKWIVRPKPVFGILRPLPRGRTELNLRERPRE